MTTPSQTSVSGETTWYPAPLLSELPALREAVVAWFGERAGGTPSPACIGRIERIIHEGFSNAVRHGAPPLCLSVRLQGSAGVIEIHDFGKGFDLPRPFTAPAFNDEVGGGLGLVILTAAATNIDYVRGSPNRLIVEFTLQGCMPGDSNRSLRRVVA